MTLILEPVNSLSCLSIPSAISVNAPDLQTITGLAFLVILLAGSALMSASEVAYFSFKPEDIEKFKTSKDKQSKTAIKLYNNPERLQH
jgi:CBS domain containing-hemolysin-like protein